MILNYVQADVYNDVGKRLYRIFFHTRLYRSKRENIGTDEEIKKEKKTSMLRFKIWIFNIYE